MIVDFLDFFVVELFPALFQFLDSLQIADGVSFLGVLIAVILLCVVIGSVLMRV